MTIRKFDTREEAKAFLEKYDSGTYYLHHGEYSRPNYSVRKIRNENAFGIYVTRYYYPTTLNAKKDGFLTWEETYEYE